MAADGPGGGPSEAELQQMLAEMREAPAEQVLVEVVNLLLQAAQVKLGRPDARVLIDAVAAVADAAAGRADPGLLGQLSQAVTRIRMAQVEAEGASGASTPSSGAEAATGMDRPAAPEPPPSRAAANPPGPRLWVPGR